MNWIYYIKLSQEDKYWDWVFKLRYTANNDNIEAYAIEYENETQGLMQYFRTGSVRAKDTSASIEKILI